MGVLHTCGFLDSDRRQLGQLVETLDSEFVERLSGKGKGTSMGGEGQALKRIPRIKFPQRHPDSSASASASGTRASSSASDVGLSFFSGSKASATVGGKASLQPKRTPVSNEEIEAILLGGSF